MENKKEKLYAIYEAMADKTLSEGCIVMPKEWLLCYTLTASDTPSLNYREFYSDRYRCSVHIKEIIWHPVRIWDVMHYIKTHNHTGWYNFNWTDYRLPIDDQDESCIDYVFSLIQK